ncbi:MAG: UbiA prenyltransferase family protein [Gaiella sp.]|jgi:4-hydroxybenzoate polyprenyltransferase|uniref:UbiA prenyltransferase family protein n=1 Tax=Gaiella sp. TaxID=2663207 RepID=UPI002C712923|nr:UbiA prenyltransferase family protein [Gaiella sp.]
MAEPAAVLELPRRRSPAAAALVAMRPRQWTKNLLLFAGIIFAAKLGDPARWLAAVTAFVAYCAASSAAYLVNDVRDAESDRLHPVKRSRPIARGELSPQVALALAGALALAAVVLAGMLGPMSLACLAAFVALQAAYSLGLKAFELVDVLAIAGLFVLRASAGAIAVDVRISEWLLLCTFLLALFVALGKRRAELGLDGVRARPALDGYSVALVDQLLGIVAAATIAAYTGYALAAHDTRWLVATVPLVVYGLFRYLLLLHRRGLGEEPESLLVEDLPLLVTVAVWAAACAVILAFG